MAEETTPFMVRLDADDRRLLDAASRAEKLDRSTVLRRALRAYAGELGVKANEPQRRQGSTKGKRRQ